MKAEKSPKTKTKKLPKKRRYAKRRKDVAVIQKHLFPPKKKETKQKTQNFPNPPSNIDKKYQPPLLKTSTPNIGVSTSRFSRMPSVFLRSKKLWHSPTTIIHSARARPV
jgi:hypothetical protein